MNNNQKALFALLRAGLWAVSNDNLNLNGVDWEDVYTMSEQQGVVGLVTAGIETLNDNTNLNVPMAVKLQFVGETLRIEQRNRAMNWFIAELVRRMRDADIFTILVKGQGVAQCYERPLCRPSGDVDFLLSKANYKKARAFLLPLSSGNKDEERYSHHLGMNIGEWYVEIHGSMRTGLSGRVDKIVDAVLNNIFYSGNVRSWQNGIDQVFLPAPTNDVFLVFTHFIKHFYKEGTSLRQICDWCRLLWTYRDKLDYVRLEKWIKKSGLMKEWNGFAAVAVKYLGMPKTAMPFINFNNKFNQSNKDERLVDIILNGNRGKVRNTYVIAKIFPWHTIKFLPSIFLNVNGLKVKERLFYVDNSLCF